VANEEAHNGNAIEIENAKNQTVVDNTTAVGNENPLEIVLENETSGESKLFRICQP
jgi:hypothetical protein